VTPIESALVFNISIIGSLTTLKEVNDLISLFKSPSESSCKITDWFLSSLTSTDKVEKGSIYQIFQQDLKEEGVDSLKIDPKKNLGMFEQIEARLWVYIGTNPSIKRLMDEPVKITINF